MKKVMFLLKVWKLIIKKKHFEIVNHHTGEVIDYTPGWTLIGFTRYLLYIMEREILEMEDLTICNLQRKYSALWPYFLCNQ